MSEAATPKASPPKALGADTWMQRAALAALLLSLLAHAAWGALYIERTSFPVSDSERIYVLWDDAMISMRYARNFAEGNGLLWNPKGERVQGYTNLGFTLLMAGVHVFASPERASLVIQVFCLIALLLCSYTGAHLVRQLGGSAWAASALAAALALYAPHSIFALQGAETVLVTLSLLYSLRLFARAHANSEAWPLRAFLPLGLAVLVRPDASLFVVCAVALPLLWPDKRGVRAALAPAVMLGAIWLGLIAFSSLYYSDPLPNTWYLKATGAPIEKVLASGWRQLLHWGVPLAGVLAFAGVAALLRIRQPVIALIALMTAVGAAYHVWVGGDWVVEHGSRHLVQVTPLLFVLAALGLDAIAVRIQALPRAAGGLLATALLVVAASFASPQVPRIEWFDRSSETLHRNENYQNFLRARFLRDSSSPDTSVAVHWAGIGPYFAERPAIDVLGHSDRHIAHLEVERFSPGHSKWDWDYVIDQRQPDVIDFSSRNLSKHAGFRANYVIGRLGPQAYVIVRRDSLHKLAKARLRIAPIESEFPGPSTNAPLRSRRN